MKKVSYIVITVLIGLICFASCKKEYHCECTYNNQLITTIDLGNQTKSNATSTCSKYDTSTIPGEVMVCTVY